MMDQNYDDLNELVNSYSKLNTKEKEKILKEDLEDLISFLSKSNKLGDNGINLEKNDYLDIIFMDLQIVKDLIATYIENVEFKEENNE